MADVDVNKFAKGSLTLEEDIRNAFSTVNNNFTTINVISDFDGSYASLTGTPFIPSQLEDLGITDGTAGQILQTDGNGNFTFVDKPVGGSGGGGFADFDFGVAADDSTIRQVTSGESIKFVGGGNVQTSSDVEGNITITYVQPANVSTFNNDAGYLTNASTIPFFRIDATPTTLSGYGITDAATSAQGSLAATSIQPGDLITELSNNAGYITNSALSSYATQTFVTSQGYITSSALNGYATENFVTTRGYLTSVSFAQINSKPTTIAGYGITDAFNGTFGALTNKPTTLAGYGITNAATSAQGSLADSAVQPGDNISTLTNNAGYITGIGSLSIDALSDVDTTSTPPTTGQVLKWNGTNWAPGVDATTGGAGLDADTLDGFDSSYFLNYNNLSNTPTTLGGEIIVAADDSTEQTISAGEVLQIAGGTNVTTSSDTEGKITIDVSISTVANATEADTVKTIQQSGRTGNHFLTFVPDDNIIAAAETIYTDAGVTFDPDTNALAVTGNVTAGTLNTHTIPGGTGTLALTSDIPAAYANSDVDAHLNTGTATTGEVLSWTGTDYDWVAQSGGVALTDLSVTTNAAGTAALSYDNATGVFTYTPPDVSNYLTEVSTGDFAANVFIPAAGEANYTDTEILSASFINNLFNNETLATIVNRGGTTTQQITVPSIQFEGSTADSFETVLQVIDPTADRTISLPNATGTVALLSDVPTNTSQLTNNSGYITTSALSGYATESFVTGQGYITSSALSGYATESFVTSQGYITSSALTGYATEAYVTSQGYLTTGGVDTHLNTSGAGTNEVLSWNGSDYAWVAQSGGGGDVVTDTTPQLGGNLDLNSNDVTGTGNINITGAITASGTVTADTFETTSTGAATVEAATNLNLDAGNAVVISNSPLRLKSYTTTQRNALTSQAGDVIYNTTNARVEFYENGAWSNSHTIHTFGVVNNGSSAYTFTDTDNHWFPAAEDNPVLYLRRGETYVFDVNASTHPFEIRVSNGGAAYSTGVTNNSVDVGAVTFKVPMSAPATLYYQCTVHSAMGAVINIV
jgi:hypothetical protein